MKNYYELNSKTRLFLDDLELDQRDTVCDQACIFFVKGNEVQIDNYIRYAREMLYSPDVEFEKPENFLRSLSYRQQIKWSDEMIRVMLALASEGYSYVQYLEKYYKELFKNNPLTVQELYDLLITSFSYCEYAIEQACERV